MKKRRTPGQVREAKNPALRSWAPENAGAGRTLSAYQLVVIRRAFAKLLGNSRAVMVKRDALVKSIGHDLYTTALLDGVIRAGVFGCWLRETPDPGAAAVMRRAMGEKEEVE